MELALPWMLWVAGGALAAAIVVFVVVFLLRRRARRAAAVPVAHSERLRRMEGFREALHRRRLALAGTGILGLGLLVVLALLGARPIDVQTVRPVEANRDIMLCLDVSGSMIDVDSEVVQTFERLVEEFEGERIGLTLFNSSPVQVFPLTDDYPFVLEQLENVDASFNGDYSEFDYWTGTNNGNGASLIGDGLAACAMRFDHVDSERSRSIIFATDNQLMGSPILQLEEAAAYAAGQDVKVYALNPFDGSAESEAFRAAAESTGGGYYPLRSQDAVADIVDRISAEEAATIEGRPQLLVSDRPDLLIGLAMLLLVGLLLAVWRLRT